MKKLLLFFFVTIINGFIILFRDSFQFIKYSTYNELYGECGADCRDKWKLFLVPYPDSDLKEARRLLQPLRFDTATSTLSRIRLIGHNIYSQFHEQSGLPGQVIHIANPVDQYKILTADRTQKIWCGTYAQMFNFFCWSQNIVCRNVEIMKPGDHHVLNECFVPELNQWVMVDLTSGILLAQKNGQLLNIQDFLTALERPSFSIENAGSLTQQPFIDMDAKSSIQHYYKKEYPFLYYHVTKGNIIYTTGAKIKRYIFPDYWYEIFSTDKKTNNLFYIKAFFLLIWVILLSAIFIKIFKK